MPPAAKSAVSVADGKHLLYENSKYLRLTKDDQENADGKDC